MSHSPSLLHFIVRPPAEKQIFKTSLKVLYVIQIILSKRQCKK